ncbi:uncharacterized protein LOC142639446 [Castanea sativa]|uniref:uncharacterized protein LOC142639446 n=1 Tax=Castanea sativa TaxID=21020 RepID=UPI003F652555
MNYGISFDNFRKKFNLPWLCVGDFNEIIRSSEKLGGSNRSQAQMQLFRDVVDECGFIDLGFSGNRFTWQKHFSIGHSIWERLDRAFAINDWLLRLAGTKIHHHFANSSDHCPLWINTVGLDFHSAPKLFKFNEMWLSDWGCSEIVEAVWDARGSDDPTSRTVPKIEK